MTDQVMPTIAAGAPAGAAAAAPPRRHIEVVPLKGLPIVALIVAGLIVSIATNARWALGFYHVTGGALWTSIDLFVGFVVGPIIGRLSMPARTEFIGRFMPMMVIIMPTVVLMTLAAGFQLAMGLGNLDPSSPNHAWLVASFVVVGIMATVALGVLEPANIAVLVELNKPRPAPAIIGNLMKRFMYTAAITGAMQVATLVIMTRVATQ